jgi:hypothetical protein
MLVLESWDAMADHAAATPLCLQIRSRSEDVSLVAHRELEFEFQRNRKKRKWQLLLLRSPQRNAVERISNGLRDTFREKITATHAALRNKVSG